MNRVVVNIEGLHTVYRTPAQDFVIHRDLHLRIEQAWLVSIVGGSGSGKTTLLRQILGLETPTRGRVQVLGQSAGQAVGAGAASRVGMLFQRGALFSAFSVLDNIALPLRELGTLPAHVVREAAMLKLHMVGLGAEHADKMPAEISGGMIKRVALARALIMDPPLLLLDEPTAGLDPEASDSFCALLKSLHQELGLTVLMVTHDLDTIFELSTHIAVLADQQVLACAPPQQVLALEHPFVKDFFWGERGRRAMALLQRQPISSSKE
jgi:phospholipid/cholesterol/gamma-HCH transport system ATP-binding protein